MKDREKVIALWGFNRRVLAVPPPAHSEDLWRRLIALNHLISLFVGAYNTGDSGAAVLVTVLTGNCQVTPNTKNLEEWECPLISEGPRFSFPGDLGWDCLGPLLFSLISRAEQSLFFSVWVWIWLRAGSWEQASLQVPLLPTPPHPNSAAKGDL